ncbi:hypothetical protein Pint_35696 [Pistacia integerrima]|uniref:Uncharacterized protein n=1 Tax=Pistacia integerrima TaxID=434235 RepID=A0ACC0Y115_9ROSI|nr:hypothetical protein Pint_35696 [Pistacia integerrima]
MKKLIFQGPNRARSVTDVTSNVSYAWNSIRVPMVVPLLRLAIILCSVMPVMLLIERVYMATVIMFVKLMGRKRYTKYKFEEMKEKLPHYVGSDSYVYKLSIGAASGLSWPSDRLMVQVLDDSTNEALRKLVELECLKWIAKAVNVKYETRNNGNGYKAGALKEGLEKQYVKDCEFVVILDADFQPEVDFLWRTIPYLLENPELGLVQATWKFGTAGVWRIQAIEDAGGWKDRTTVEDMDLAVRASLKGWKFVFVGDLGVKNELPSTFKAYRFQWHRWSCGPSNLFRKITREIILCERVTIWKRLHLIYAFFIVRKIITHWVTFFFYCIVIPASVLVPEIQLTKPIAIYIPATITLLNAVCTPRSFHLIVFWILFESVMSLL